MISINILPSVFVLDGNIIVPDDKNYKKVGKAVKLIKSIKEDTLYILDVNAITKNKPQINLIQEISKEKNLWVEGAVFLEDVTDVLVSGAEYAVVNSRFVHWDELKKICNMSQNIMLHVECKNHYRSISPEIRNMGIDRLIQAANHMGVEKFIIDTDDHSLLDLLAKNVDVYTFAKKDEIKKLENSGVAGVLVEAFV